MDDAERAALIAQLPPIDRLHLLIGRVAQADVMLEYTLRHLWSRLAGAGLSVVVTPNSFVPLLEQCVAMFQEAPVSAETRTHGLDALSVAKSAHAARDRVVHDIWAPMFDSTPSEEDAFSTQRSRQNRPPTVTKRRLQDVEAIVTQQKRVNLRLTVLTFLIPLRSPHLQQPQRPEQVAELELAILRDEFDLTADGSANVRTTGAGRHRP